MYRDSVPPTLPIPPQDLLKRFMVHDPVDTRFQSCARLLQSIWREERNLDPGTYSRPGFSIKALGSRLAPEHARAGFNYLRPDIAKLVRRELAFREVGALIDETRTWENLLSSTALVFNLLGPLKLQPELAKRVLNATLPLKIETVTGVYFETSPGRSDETYIGDRTALDALVTYKRKDGSECFIGIEVKYSEGAPPNASPVRERLLDVAKRSKLFIDAAAADLHQAPLRQFFAEHSLCHAIGHEHRHFERGDFIVLAPAMNSEMAAVVQSYQRHLNVHGPALIPFRTLSLESVVAAIGNSGEAALAGDLDRRYLNFDRVYELIDDWIPHAAA